MYFVKATLLLLATVLFCNAPPALAVMVSDDFSSNTAGDYTGSNSFGSGGSFSINSGGNGQLRIATGSGNTYSVMRANAEMGVGDRYSIEIEGTRPSNRSQFVMISTNTGQPNHTSSYGWRLARDNGVPSAYRIQLLDNASNTYADGSDTPTFGVFFPGVVNEANPQTIHVDRVSDTMFHFYRQQGSAAPQLIGMGANSNLASASHLHVGVQGFGNSGGALLYDNLSVAPTAQSTSQAVFQQGVNGYSGAVDTYLSTGSPTTVQNGNVSLRVLGGTSQALLRFDDLFGAASGQIPLGAQIVSATLSVQTRVVENTSALTTASFGVATPTTLSIHQLLTAFDANTATYNSTFGGNGVQANDIEAALAADDTRAFSTIVQGQLVQFDVTGSLQSWSDGEDALGWLLQQISGNDDWHIWAQDGFAAPLLQVEYYVVPEPSTLVLTFAAACLGLVFHKRRKRS